MFKPPKMSSNHPSDLSTPPAPPVASFNQPSSSAPETQVQEDFPAFSPDRAEEQRVWSPTSEPPMDTLVSEEPAMEQSEFEAPVEPTSVDKSTPNMTATETVETVVQAQAEEELVADPENESRATADNNTIDQEQPKAFVAPFDIPMQPLPAAAPAIIPPMDEKLRYARPTEQTVEPVPPPPSEPTSAAEPESTVSDSSDTDEKTINDDKVSSASIAEADETIKRLLGKDQKIVRSKSIRDIPFSDIWYTAENIAYIRDTSTKFALVPFESEDLEDFLKTLEQGYTGQSSYAIRFAGEQYRVERVITLSGPQYNCRKMPGTVPDIYTLGLPKHVVDYLLTLSHESGLLLFGGPTGMGKTTSASALMKKFLEMEGGFMYTIEDPPEMPLDGLYHAENGGLGLCKQCPVDNERWGDGIKSALRSRPRYILVGEIRTPETASQVLRAATSGHLVLSTVHASTVEDALESVIKYASGAGLTESLAADLLARGILGVIHQKLEGAETLRPVITSAFANPHLTGGDQMRSLIRNQTINLQTLVEAQSSRLFQGRPLFENVSKEK